MYLVVLLLRSRRFTGQYAEIRLILLASRCGRNPPFGSHASSTLPNDSVTPQYPAAPAPW